LSIAGVQDIDLSKGKFVSEDRFFIGISVVESNLGWNPFEQIEFEMDFGGFMIWVEPEAQSILGRAGRRDPSKATRIFLRSLSNGSVS